jgi:signal peptidase I
MRPINNTTGGHVILVLILATGVTGIVRNCVGTFAVVQGVSMRPTFNPNDVVQAKTLHARPARGDVVIITDDRGDRVMKRIIGLPGEMVTLYKGFIYIDRQRINEPYLPRHTYTFKSEETDQLPADWRLGDDEYFVLGDNRFESHDSRDFGPVKNHHIHSVVSLPKNETKPEFVGIMLIGSGRATSAIFSPSRERTRSYHQISSAKI